MNKWQQTIKIKTNRQAPSQKLKKTTAESTFRQQRWLLQDRSDSSNLQTFIAAPADDTTTIRQLALATIHTIISISVYH